MKGEGQIAPILLGISSWGRVNSSGFVAQEQAPTASERASTEQ